MSDTQAVTILSRRFPAKRTCSTGVASGLGRVIAMRLADWHRTTDLDVLGVAWGGQTPSRGCV